MESSRRDLLNNMAERRSTLKINQITCYLRFIFALKAGKNSLKEVYRFYCFPVHGSYWDFFSPNVTKTSEIYRNYSRISKHLTKVRKKALVKSSAEQGFPLLYPGHDLKLIASGKSTLR